MVVIEQVKVIIKNGDKYLLLKKVSAMFKEHIGGWEVSGGKLEQGEDAIVGGLREVKEETGQDCTIIKELSSLTHEKEENIIHTRVFLAILPSKSVTLSKEHSEYCWKSRDEIERMENVIYKESLLKYLEEAMS